MVCELVHICGCVDQRDKAIDEQLLQPLEIFQFRWALRSMRCLSCNLVSGPRSVAQAQNLGSDLIDNNRIPPVAGTSPKHNHMAAAPSYRCGKLGYGADTHEF